MRIRITWLIASLALIAGACGGTANSDGVATLDDVDTNVQAAASEGATLNSTTASTTIDGEIDEEAAFIAFTECMRGEGIEMSDPTVDADGNVQPGRPEGFGEPGSGSEPDPAFRETFQAAREMCSDTIAGITLGFQEVDQTELQDTLLAYAQCMRDNDYDMADPDLAAIGQRGGPGSGPFGEIDREDPSFIAADEVCSELTGGFGQGRGLGRPGGGEG